MNDFVKLFISIYSLLINTVFVPSSVNAIKFLPESCRFENVSDYFIVQYNEKTYRKYKVVMCDVNNDVYEFKFKSPISSNSSSRRKCDMFNNQFGLNRIIFKWPSSNGAKIIDKRFNLTNVLRYYSYLNCTVDISLWNMNGFDLDMFELNQLNTFSILTIVIEISNSRLNFYHDKSKIISCQDITDLNLTRIESLFQTPTDKVIGLRNNVYESNMCPLLFSNSRIHSFVLIDLVDSFYRKSVLSFSNETFSNLNSTIEYLIFVKVININLDLNLLHPSVFAYTSTIGIRSTSLNSIDEAIFKHLKHLSTLTMSTNIFRKINHKQGIGWIRQINYGLNVNLSNLSSEEEKSSRLFEIIVDSSKTLKIFPDEDFCLYVNFPFNQFVIVFDLHDARLEKKYSSYSCTHLWLARYYEHYYKYFIKRNKSRSYVLALLNVVNSRDFKSISKCDFEERIRLCNKSNYRVNDIWDDSDFYILNKKLQTAFKISLYPVSLLGLVTNLIVVIVILHKDNNDLFKGLKQYSYLWLNSIFCIMISVIEILSWMTECFYPFEVFCPEIRKLVGVQFFKIIFSECLVTMFRFMCSFTYVAFALNRISLIGVEHVKLVKFMSELGIKKYVIVAVLISMSLSWIKYFKYEINYFYPNSNFPMSNEVDLSTSYLGLFRFDDFYFIFNSISDLVNYLVFMVICIVIDVSMVVKLNRTLNEKSIKSALMNQKINETKKAENEEAVNKAIKMVVLNSVIGIFFKLPILLIPIINLCARFYFSSYDTRLYQASFRVFYSTLISAGFNALIQDMTHVLFNFSLSMQMFIYNRFDKKFRIGYDRLKDKVFIRIKNLF